MLYVSSHTTDPSDVTGCIIYKARTQNSGDSYKLWTNEGGDYVEK